MQDIVRKIAEELVASGSERGLQVAVYRRGELLVDVVAGDAAPGRPFTPDTPVYAASTGKGVSAAVVHALAERGVLGYDTRIGELWPEFGAYGKERVTVRHALSHQSGVPEATTAEDLCDWERMCAALERARPWWEPGTRCGYHALTFGFVLDEVVRRATGRRISQVLEEVAGPLGVSGEVFLALPEGELDRLARIEEVAPSVGTMTAHGIARIYDALLTGELVSPGRLRELSSPAVEGVDEVTGVRAAWGLGYGVGLTPGLAARTVFGMPGSGGTMAFADTATGVAVGVMKNRATPGDFAAADRIGSAVLNGAQRCSTVLSAAC